VDQEYLISYQSKEFHKMKGSDKIASFSKKYSLPEWWVTSINIEYFNCRRFAEGEELWTFDFKQVSEEEITKIPNLDILISANVVLYHNVSRAELVDKFTKIMSGQPYSPISKEIEINVEGPASPDYFQIWWNPIEVWDPKLDFSRYCILLNRGIFYQWKIADFVTVEGKHRGAWKSNVVDLTELLSVNEKIQDLREQYHLQKDHSESIKYEAKKLYDKLEEARKPIRDELRHHFMAKIN
jgi:hypothetical protein